MHFLVASAVFAFLFIGAVFAGERYRQLECTTPNGEPKAGPEVAQCRLVLKDSEGEAKGRAAPIGEGCFSERQKSGEERVYCDLACPNSAIWFHSPISQGHKACFKGYTYSLEERHNEWYIWRSAKCLNSTATFTVGCKFNDELAFNAKFPNDAAIFAQLKQNSKKDGKKN